MRVNRRSLIQMLGLGAAAAALAPSVGQAAGSTDTLTVSGGATMTGDLTITTNGLMIRDTADGMAARFSYGTGAPFRVIKPGDLVDPAEVKAITDAIANARADGYNRGREVESARWEARQDPSVTLSQVSRGWIYTQTGDGIVVERANA